MSIPKTYRRVQTREFAAHHMLLRVADRELGEAQKNLSGSFNHSLVVITFSALAMEALANAIGDRVIEDWPDFESANPYAKLRLLAERLGVPYATPIEPWRTLRWLHKFRNNIAHPRPERIVLETRVGISKASIHSSEPPDSRLEKQVSVGNAKRALKALHEVKDLLCEKIPPEDSFGLYSEGWSTSTEPHCEP